MSMEDTGRGRLSPDGPAPQAVTLTAGLAVAYARGEAALDAMSGAAGAASRGGPPLDWQHWGLLLARALEQVLHPLRPALSSLPAGGAAVEAAGPDGMLTGLTAAEAAELAARLRSAETSLRPMPAGTQEGSGQILAEVTGLREIADTQASRRAARARHGGRIVRGSGRARARQGRARTMTAPATALAPAAGSSRAVAARTATEMASQLDRRAGRAWRAGDLGAAARLIGAARRLDPERAAVWDRREALIRARPASSPDDAGGSPAAREPGQTAGPAGPAQLASWRELIETALTRPGALPAGTAQKVIAAWLSELEQPCGRCAHQQAIHVGGAHREGWPVYDQIWVHAAGPCTADGCTCPRRVPPGPGQAGGLQDARAYRRIAEWDTAVIARVGTAAGTGAPTEDGGPAL